MEKELWESMKTKTVKLEIMSHMIRLKQIQNAFPDIP